MELTILLIAVFAHLAIAIFVLTHRRKDLTAFLFSLLSIILAIWNIFNYLSFNQATSHDTLYYIRLVMFLNIFDRYYRITNSKSVFIFRRLRCRHSCLAETWSSFTIIYRLGFIFHSQLNLAAFTEIPNFWRSFKKADSISVIWYYRQLNFNYYLEFCFSFG